MNKIFNKCTSRFSLSDMGWHECQLEKNHKGSHKHKVKRGEDYTKIGYTLTWPKDKHKDVNVTTNWLKKNTNLFEIIDKELINFKDYFSGYKIDDVSFNGPIHGDKFSLYIYLKPISELEKVLKNDDYDKYLKFTEKYFIDKYNKFEGYESIDFDFHQIVHKQIQPNLDKYKVFINFNISGFF